MLKVCQYAIFCLTLKIQPTYAIRDKNTNMELGLNAKKRI